jgi:hypothetical protein
VLSLLLRSTHLEGREVTRNLFANVPTAGLEPAESLLPQRSGFSILPTQAYWYGPDGECQPSYPPVVRG